MIDAYLLFALIVAALALFIWGYWRYDIVALSILMIAVLIGIVPFHNAFTGFSNPAVITVACVMVITEAITLSGFVDFFVKKMSSITAHPNHHVISLTFVAGIFSAFMNNVGALALMMPIAIQTSIKNKRSPSMILMPLAFGSALGGLTTAIGTPPNILIATFRQTATGTPFTMFDFTPIGLTLAVIGILFITFIGWRLIPYDRKAPENSDELFQINDYIAEVKIPDDSPVVGKTVKELEHLIEGEFVILGMIRRKQKRFVVRSMETLEANDLLIIEASHTDLAELVKAGKLIVGSEKTTSTDILKSKDVKLVEAVVPPASRLEGRSAQTLRLRSRHNINLLALAREGRPLRKRLNNIKLRAGDIILLQGDAETVQETIVNLGFLPLVERSLQVGLPRRGILSIGIFVLAIIFAATQTLPVQISFATAVTLMVLLKIIPIRKVYESIDWSIIVMLGALIPLGTAIETTGAAAMLVHFILPLAEHVPMFVLIAVLMIVTMTLSDFMNNAATTVVMAPIAVSIANILHLNVDPFLMTIAIGASCSFLTPIGHQNNMLVMGPGGYRFFDYWRLGLPLEIIILIISVPMILWIWPVSS